MSCDATTTRVGRVRRDTVKVVTYLSSQRRGPGTKPSKSTVGHVYFAWLARFRAIKIGWSLHHPEVRLRSHLADGRLGRCLLLGFFVAPKAEEYAVHRQLSADRLRTEDSYGRTTEREIFRPTAAVYAALAERTGVVIQVDHARDAKPIVIPGPVVVRLPAPLEAA